MDAMRAELIREVVKLGEARVQAQVQLATAADSRAMALCGISSAAAGVVLAATQVIQSSSGILGLAAAGMFYLVGAGLAGWSARPQVMDTPGWEPSKFEHDIAGCRSVDEVSEEMLPFVERGIRENDDLLAANGRFLTAALFFVITAPVSGVLGWAIATG